MKRAKTQSRAASALVHSLGSVDRARKALVDMHCQLEHADGRLATKAWKLSMQLETLELELEKALESEMN